MEFIWHERRREDYLLRGGRRRTIIERKEKGGLFIERKEKGELFLREEVSKKKDFGKSTRERDEEQSTITYM